MSAKQSSSHHSSRQFRFMLFLWLCILCPSVTQAHSTLAYPRPYSYFTMKGFEACPPAYPKRGLYNSPEKPATTWRRGQRVNVRWFKNNHEGGFVRLSLVPLSQMYQRDAHTRFAFYYGCWEQNKHPCGEMPCGADREGFAFYRRLRVPRMIPDGVFVLAYMWFGGLSESRRHGRYGDFVSCSFVRIRGGHRLKRWYRPIFRAGKTGAFETNPAGRCYTSANSPTTCRMGCEYLQPKMDIPRVFQSGSRPVRIKAVDYFDAMPPSPSVTPSVTPRPSRSPAPTVSPSASRTPTPSPTPTPSISPPGTPSPTPSITPSATPSTTPSPTLSRTPSTIPRRSAAPRRRRRPKQY